MIRSMLALALLTATPAAAQGWLDLPLPGSQELPGRDAVESCARDSWLGAIGDCVGTVARACIADGGWNPPASVIAAEAVELWCDGWEMRAWQSVHATFAAERRQAFAAQGRHEAMKALAVADAAFDDFLRAECGSEVDAWGPTAHREAARARVDCQIDHLSRRSIAVLLRGVP